jgi:hypothetical protein
MQSALELSVSSIVLKKKDWDGSIQQQTLEKKNIYVIPIRSVITFFWLNEERFPK